MNNLFYFSVMFTFCLTVLLTIFYLGYDGHPILSSASLISAWDFLCNTCRAASQNCDLHLCGIWDELCFRGNSLIFLIADFQINSSSWLRQLTYCNEMLGTQWEKQDWVFRSVQPYFWTNTHHSVSLGTINGNNNLTFCNKDCYDNK